jgi:hypothetical protein
MYVSFHVMYQLLSYLIKLEFSRQIFEKYSNMKFHEKSFSGSRVVPSGLTDRHDEADNRCSQFANACNNTIW